MGDAGSKDDWDFGEGAGFYLNATQPGWEKWRMHDYVTKELPTILQQFKELHVDKVCCGPMMRTLCSSRMTATCASWW